MLAEDGHGVTCIERPSASGSVPVQEYRHRPEVTEILSIAQKSTSGFTVCAEPVTHETPSNCLLNLSSPRFQLEYRVGKPLPDSHYFLRGWRRQLSLCIARVFSHRLLRLHDPGQPAIRPPTEGAPLCGEHFTTGIHRTVRFIFKALERYEENTSGGNTSWLVTVRIGMQFWGEKKKNNRPRSLWVHSLSIHSAQGLSP
jgi:hypothetical protein